MGLAQILNKGTAKKNISVLAIRNNPENHYSIDNDEVKSIAESIAAHGQLEPGIVYEEDSDEDEKHYTLVSGEKRWRAVTLLLNEGRHSGNMEVVVIDKPENKMELLELINDANLQRKKDKKTLYYEIKQKYEYYSYLKENGRKPELHKRDWTAKALGISSRQVDLIIKEIEGGKPEKSDTEVSPQKKYNEEFSAKIAEKYQFKTKVTPKTITFKCDDTDELNELLAHFGIDMVYDFGK